MDRAEHHRAADRLLEKAGKEQDSIRQNLILAEAQVHATLAAAAAETGTGRQGESEAVGGQGAGEVPPTGPADDDPLARYLDPAKPGSGSREESPRRHRDPAAPASAPQSPAQAPPTAELRLRQPLRPPRLQGPVPARPRTIWGNSAEEEPDPEEQGPGGPEQEPGPVRWPPGSGDPGEQEPGGGFRPF
jgi:hypothetical protein